MAGLQAGKQVGGISREIGQDGEDLTCFLFVVGVGGDVAFIAVIEPINLGPAKANHVFCLALCFKLDLR